MIARISGKVIEKGQNYLIIDVNSICYQVFIPQAVMQHINESAGDSGVISLITYHYYQIEPSKGVPVLVGFINEIEKEFFEIFITVSGIGPRAALKALNQPISQIARAIDEGDVNFLKSLPGIGQQRAKEVIAKLQNKVGKFGLIQDVQRKSGREAIRGIEEEALAVLVQLEYKKHEAILMLKKALERSPGIQSAEELLNEVYKQKKTI